MAATPRKGGVTPHEAARLKARAVSAMERQIKDNLTIIMIQVELLESKEVTDEELERIAAAVRRCATAAEGVM